MVYDSDRDVGEALVVTLMAVVVLAIVICVVGVYREEKRLAAEGWHHHGTCEEVDCSATVGDVEVPCTRWRCR